jgi:hypothetical protein
MERYLYGGTEYQACLIPVLDTGSGWPDIKLDTST